MSRKIGWQKYEDVIQSEMYSPMANILFDDLASEIDEEEYEEEREMQEQETLFLPKNFYETISLMSRFDCWIGHTNFNITTSIKNKLNEVDGIEVLNVVSRYRFFIGIGKMFQFSDVRKDIEKTIISKGETLGSAIEESP
jgi:hypothetical protein|tara:strand:+ start:2818 stop:3237 length:420 start_codon:yes stop_codon:yes gene_type:complete